MANKVYDNLTVLMNSGELSWTSDAINAYLMRDSAYTAADINLSEAGGTQISRVPVQGRQVSLSHELLGLPVSFTRLPKDQSYQVVIAKDLGPGTDPLVLAFFDRNREGEALRLKNNGTLIVRPGFLNGSLPPVVGVWVHVTQPVESPGI